MIDQIPAFVVRGASLWVTQADGHRVIEWRNEADLRDALAAEWWFHGAAVRTEVKVPDCGRIDVQVELGLNVLVIEVKRAVTTPTLAREAYQQAHAYVSYLEAEYYEQEFSRRTPFDECRRVHGFVAAPTFDGNAARRANSAYPSVTGMTFGNALYEASHGPDRGRAEFLDLLPVAQARQRAVDNLLNLLRDSEIEMVTEIESTRLAELQAAS